LKIKNKFGYVKKMLYVCVKFKNAIKMTKFEKRQKMWEYCINNLPFSDDDFNTRRRNKYDFMNKDRNPNEQVHDVMTFGTAIWILYAILTHNVAQLIMFSFYEVLNLYGWYQWRYKKY